MVHTREQAARNAEAARTNKPGTCQLWTRNLYGAPSAGDRDGDGDYDAVDGWKSEPAATRHPGDKNPPRGVPVAWAGGSRGFGHRAISLGGGLIRTIDMADGRYKAGVVGTATIDQITRAMGLSYLGWSPTISGILIPDDTPRPAAKKQRPKPVRVAIKSAEAAIAAVDEQLATGPGPVQRSRLVEARAALVAGRAKLKEIEKR